MFALIGSLSLAQPVAVHGVCCLSVRCVSCPPPCSSLARDASRPGCLSRQAQPQVTVDTSPVTADGEFGSTGSGPQSSPCAPRSGGAGGPPAGSAGARPRGDSAEDAFKGVAVGTPVDATAEPTEADADDENEAAGEDAALSDAGVESTALSTTELFLRVNSVIPEAQELQSIEPGSPCSDGLELLAKNAFSQAPIVRGKQVIGLFSYRSFSRAAAGLAGSKPGDVPVEEAMEDPVWVRATDELGPLMEVFDARDAVLVGDEDDLQAIVTGMDVLRRLDALTEPFVRLRGIELALRQLVDAATDVATLARLAREALASEFADRVDDPPTKTEDMTLGQLTGVVLYGPSWQHMKTTLGANRSSATTHLTGLSSLRNDVLHFRRQVDKDELGRIKTTSDWLRTRMRAVGLTEGGR